MIKFELNLCKIFAHTYQCRSLYIMYIININIFNNILLILMIFAIVSEELCTHIITIQSNMDGISELFTDNTNIPPFK